MSILKYSTLVQPETKLFKFKMTWSEKTTEVIFIPNIIYEANI